MAILCDRAYWRDPSIVSGPTCACLTTFDQTNYLVAGGVAFTVCACGRRTIRHELQPTTFSSHADTHRPPTLQTHTHSTHHTHLSLSLSLSLFTLFSLSLSRATPSSIVRPSSIAHPTPSRQYTDSGATFVYPYNYGLVACAAHDYALPPQCNLPACGQEKWRLGGAMLATRGLMRLRLKA